MVDSYLSLLFAMLREFEKMKNIFPMLQLFLCLGACLVYILHKETYNALYWAGAFIITFSVIFK